MTQPQRDLGWFVVVGAAVVVLTAGLRAASGLVSPVLAAALLALVMHPLTRKLRGRVKGAVAVTTVVALVVFVTLVLAGFLAVSLRQLAGEIPGYRAQFDSLMGSVTQSLLRRGIDLAAYVDEAVRGANVGNIVLNVTSAVAGALGNAALILFIFVFMLGSMWDMELRAGTQPGSPNAFDARFARFSESLRGYVRVRALLGLVAALLNYFALLILGVNHALLWGVLSFFLSFVPNIGFALAVIPPIVLALLEFGWLRAVTVYAVYQLINIVVDNVIGPRIVARQMQISPLLSFLSVIFWAWVLGPIGAILAVPLTVLIRDLTPGFAAEVIRPAGPVASDTAGPL